MKTFGAKQFQLWKEEIARHDVVTQRYLKIGFEEPKSILGRIEKRAYLYDSRTNQTIKEFPVTVRDFKMNYITNLFILASLFGYSLMFNNSLEKRFNKNTRNKINFTTLGSLVGTSYAMFFASKGLDLQDQIEAISGTSLLVSMYTRHYLLRYNIKKIFNEDFELLSKDNLLSLSLKFKTVTEKAQNNFKKGTQDKSLEYMIEAIRISKLIDENKEEISDFVIQSRYFKDDIVNRISDLFNNSFNHYLSRVIESLTIHSPFLEYDIKRAIKKCPEEALEFRVLGAEFTKDSEESQKKWAEIYRILVEKDNLKSVDLKTSNAVAFMDSKILKKHYIFKRKNKQDLESEIEQTFVLNTKVFSGMSNVDTVEITSSLYYPLIDNQDEGIGIFNYVEGKHLSEILITAPRQQQLSLLERVVKINASTAYHGINKTIVDRQEKTTKEILSLPIKSEDKQILLNSLDVLFKYADRFPSVYDCDGHSDNIIVKQEGNNFIFIPIDIEARPQNDPAYMLVKPLEYKSVLPFDSEGIKIRNNLIRQHFLAINQNQDTDVQESHYYSSVPLKFISYLTLEMQGKAMEEVLETYRQSSLFALDTLVRNYSDNYSHQEIEKLRKISSAIEVL
jgi:hypothetical protein